MDKFANAFKDCCRLFLPGKSRVGHIYRSTTKGIGSADECKEHNDQTPEPIAAEYSDEAI